jgi:hypothetical protein
MRGERRSGEVERGEEEEERARVTKREGRMETINYLAASFSSVITRTLASPTFLE